MSEFALLPGDHPLLKKKCRPVTQDDDTSFLRKELERLCVEHNGAGLSANQIGSDLRIFALNCDTLKIYINPEIIEFYDEFVFDGEGCLSFPGEILCTKRYNRVLIASDNHPDEVLTGISAVAAQHELDHLNGITMHDRSIK